MIPLSSSIPPRRPSAGTARRGAPATKAFKHGLTMIAALAGRRGHHNLEMAAVEPGSFANDGTA